MASGIASTPENGHEWQPFDRSPQVSVIIGCGHYCRGFGIPVDTLCHYSGAFRDELAFGCLRICLPREKVEIFGMVCFYIYNKRFFNTDLEHPGCDISFNQITELWDFGRRFVMPTIQNAAIDLFADKVKYHEKLPDQQSVEYLWMLAPPGSTLRKLAITLVRECWVPDGHRHPCWVELAGGMSFNPDDLNWAIEELKSTDHRIRVSHKTTVRLLACEFHTHDEYDICEGAEEYQLLPEHLLRKR